MANEPGSAPSKGNDFTTNPGGNAKGTKPREFINVQRPQQKMKDQSLSTDEIPQGGTLPDAKPPPARQAETAEKKPFKLGGGG